MTDRRRGGPTPLYHQVYLRLRDVLTEGGAEPTRLPSEPELARRFGVSRVTVRSTLARLEAEGLVRRQRGVGTFAVPTPAPPGPQNISGLLENLISVDAATTAETLEWRLVEASPLPGPALYILRLRAYQGQAISLTTLHVAARHAHLIDPATLGDEPVVRVLDRAGVVAVTADQAISAVAADPRAAAALSVREGAPLIAMRRLMFDADRHPVLHQESLYAPERYEYRMSLSRSALTPRARWTPVG
jgi:GntR family transcriptional regulator